MDGVRTALRRIEAGRLQKVVLARKVIVDYALPVDIAATVAALGRREQSSTIFCVTSPGHSFVGASPELLVARDGPVVRSVPLAGTVRMTGDTATDEMAVARLVASTKENLEHRLVVDMVSAELAARCRTLQVPDDPEVLWLRQIAHLATPMSGRLGGEPANMAERSRARSGAASDACGGRVPARKRSRSSLRSSPEVAVFTQDPSDGWTPQATGSS